MRDVCMDWNFDSDDIFLDMIIDENHLMFWVNSDTCVQLAKLNEVIYQ